MARSTLEAHLSTAEDEIIASPIPYLEVYATATKPAKRLPLRTTLSAAIPAK